MRPAVEQLCTQMVMCAAGTIDMAPGEGGRSLLCRLSARKRCQDWWNGANLMGHGAHGVARVVACKRVVLAHDWRGVCVHE